MSPPGAGGAAFCGSRALTQRRSCGAAAPASSPGHCRRRRIVRGGRGDRPGDHSTSPCAASRTDRTPTAQHITVSTPAPAIPLSQADILALLDRAPDYGPLADPSRRASCLSGLGYPASTRVLGARPIEINARPGVLLVVPGDAPDSVTVFAVAPNCSAADTGLLASTTVARS